MIHPVALSGLLGEIGTEPGSAIPPLFEALLAQALAIEPVGLTEGAASPPTAISVAGPSDDPAQTGTAVGDVIAALPPSTEATGVPPVPGEALGGGDGEVLVPAEIDTILLAEPVSDSIGDTALPEEIEPVALPVDEGPQIPATDDPIDPALVGAIPPTAAPDPRTVAPDTADANQSTDNPPAQGVTSGHTVTAPEARMPSAGAGARPQFPIVTRDIWQGMEPPPDEPPRTPTAIGAAAERSAGSTDTVLDGRVGEGVPINAPGRSTREPASVEALARVPVRPTIQTATPVPNTTSASDGPAAQTTMPAEPAAAGAPIAPVVDSAAKRQVVEAEPAEPSGNTDRAEVSRSIDRGPASIASPAPDPAGESHSRAADRPETDASVERRAARLAGRIERWVDRVQNAPPPNVLTVRPEGRDGVTIRVALESGGLHIKVDGAKTDELPWLRNAVEQLAAKGFQLDGYDLSGSRDERRSRWERDLPTSEPGAGPARGRSQQTRRHTGLRL